MTTAFPNTKIKTAIANDKTCKIQEETCHNITLEFQGQLFLVMDRGLGEAEIVRCWKDKTGEFILGRAGKRSKTWKPMQKFMAEMVARYAA